MSGEKIVFIINSLTGGGAEKVVQTLANHLVSECEFEVLVVTLDNAPDWFGKVIKSDAPADSPRAYRFHPAVRFESLWSGGVSFPLLRVLLMPWLAFKLRRLLAREQPTAALSLLVRANLVHILSKFLGNPLPVAISEHNTTENVYGAGTLKDRFMLRLIRWLYPSADRVLAVSSGVKASLVALGLEGSEVAVVHNPVDLEQIRRLGEEEVVGYSFGRPLLVNVGQICRQKDQRTLIRALALVRRETAAELLLLGDGPELESCRALAAELGLAQVVHFLGWQPNPYAFLRQADLFVLSSRWEGFGIVLAEALACGLPVVSADCPSGPAEILENGKYGYLVPAADEHQLAGVLAKVLSDQVSMSECASKGLRRADDFAVAKVAGAYLRFLGVRQGA